jgi:hypothetical protein
MKYFASLLSCLVVASFASSPTHAQTLYGSTSAGGPGELYQLNSTNGSMLQDVGALNDASSVNYPITGLAFQPGTGLLYGSTGNAGATNTQARLVSINPATAQVTVIGSFNTGAVNANGDPATMADIGFDPTTGTLYGVGSIGGPQLYSINLTTGQATVVGSTGLTSTSGGGMAVSSAGTVYGTPTSTRYGTYNKSTGAYTNIANPTKPLGGAYAALDFNNTGVLYGLDLGPGPALATELVTFDLATGTVTNVGSSVTALDAIAFATIPEPASIGLVTCAVFILLGKRVRRTKR